MKNQTIAQLELQIKPLPWRRRRIKRPQINKRRRTVANNNIAAINHVTQKAPPAVEARCTDPFASAERFNAQSAAANLRQQRSPFAPAAPLPLVLPASCHCLRSPRWFISGAIILIARAAGKNAAGLPITLRKPANCFAINVRDSCDFAVALAGRQ
jgi:hypothetical protein